MDHEWCVFVTATASTTTTPHATLTSSLPHKKAIIPPLFLTVCFETGYVVHKHRSVKYLGINFDVRGVHKSPHPSIHPSIIPSLPVPVPVAVTSPTRPRPTPAADRLSACPSPTPHRYTTQEGKRVDTQPCSWLLRNLVRLIALALLLMGLVVNFSGFFTESGNAGMSGCALLLSRRLDGWMDGWIARAVRVSACCAARIMHLPTHPPIHTATSFLGLTRQDKAHFYVSLVPPLLFSVVSVLIGATIARSVMRACLCVRAPLKGRKEDPAVPPPTRTHWPTTTIPAGTARTRRCSSAGPWAGTTCSSAPSSSARGSSPPRL